MDGRLLALRVGCNRVVGCLDWSRVSGYVAFGAHHFIAIYDPKAAKVAGILNGHRDHVNCLKWLQGGSEGSSGMDYLVSGSADQTVMVWKWNGSFGERLAELQGFASGVTAIGHCVLDSSSVDEPSSVLLATCSSDPDVRIWHCKRADMGSWQLMTTSRTDLVCVPDRQGESVRVLLALGGTDSTVRLFVCSDGQSFHRVAVLHGHEDWVRGLDVRVVSPSKLLLASASQDRFVRVWSLSTKNASNANPLTQLAPSLSFQVADQTFTIKLDGLLIGHEDRVHSIQFNPNHERLQLLSASMDRTMVLWQWDREHQCWQQTESAGDAGCSALGYFGGVFSPDGNAILAHGFTGALHLWERDNEAEGWIPKPAMTGHYDEVVDMCLLTPKQPSQASNPFVAILSVSKDQTTRIGAMLNDNWIEIARPQVHGHDFYGVASVPDRSPDCFVSCSEEKVIRVFTAPSSFHEYLTINQLMQCADLNPDNQVHRPYGASIKALALTNTAIYENEEATPVVSEGVVESYTPGPDFAPHANPTSVTGAPLEEHLSQNTLWPEIQKLYGHGDVVFSLAVSPCGQILASGCKAQKEDTAVIFIWDTTSWTPLQQLRGHTLTVTRMEFSPSGRYLLSGSRDRTFCLYERTEGKGFQFRQRRMKAHGRIIWDVSWAADETHFATASRDQSIKIWKLPEAQCVLHLSLDDGVTAIAFHPTPFENKHILATGLQNGDILVWHITTEATCRSEQLWKTDEHNRHSGAVFRIRWLPSPAEFQERAVFASCSADHSVRLFELNTLKGCPVYEHT